MRAIPGRKAARLAVISGTILLTAATVGYATIPDQNSTFRGCVLKGVGSVRLIDTSLPSRNLQSHCTILETSVTWNQLGQVGPQGPKGSKGDDGDRGPKGDTGSTGPAGPAGPIGATGATGSEGPAGPQGPAGPLGAPAPTADSALAQVLVSRGGAAAAIWAQYSAPIETPLGATTGGTFRFTCSTPNAPCVISLQAAVEGSSTSTTHTLYPRISITKDGDGNGGDTALTQCEYADGSTNAGLATLTNQAVSANPAWSDIVTNIGRTYDCDPGATLATPPAAGNVATITVPNGYYDVTTTLSFT